jgi:uncharacterized cupredoxin-like copper-binding protein
MKPLSVAALTSGFIAISCYGDAASRVNWASAKRVEIQMIEYKFVPDQLRFHRGLPYQLHLFNAGKEGHDFTAPDFFASVDLKDTDALNERKASIYLDPGQIADIYFIATEVELFAPRCPDHDWAGMKATIVID